MCSMDQVRRCWISGNEFPVIGKIALPRVIRLEDELGFAVGNVIQRHLISVCASFHRSTIARLAHAFLLILSFCVTVFGHISISYLND